MEHKPVEPIEYNPDMKMAPPELVEINNVEALLKEVPLNPMNVIDYPMFRQTLLPIIATASTGEFNVAAWIEEVGHPFVAVTVLDGDKVLYEIPPLLDQQETLDEDGDRIGDHIQELLSIRAGSVSLANRHMANALLRTSDPNYDPIARANLVLEVLNKILTDHNYPPVPLGIATPALSVSVDEPNAMSEDVIVVTGYDPL